MNWTPPPYRYSLADRATLRLAPAGLFHNAQITDPPQSAPFTTGLALRQGSTVMLATGPAGRVEIGWYAFAGDAMTGLWVPPTGGADWDCCGRESSKRAGIESGGEVYEIQTAVAIDHQPYTGRVILTPTGTRNGPATRVAFRWELHDGVYHSFGIRLGDVMATTFCFDAGAPHAISVLTETPDGFAGYHATSTADDLLPVRWTRQ